MLGSKKFVNVKYNIIKIGLINFVDFISETSGEILVEQLFNGVF